MQIASGSWDKTVRVWDAATGKHRKTLIGHSKRVTAVAFSPDGTQIASGSWDKTVRVWDAVTGEHRKSLTGHSNPVTAVAFSPDGRQIASGSWDDMVRVWDAVTGEHWKTLTGHWEWVAAVAFSQDGTQIASGSYSSIPVRTTPSLWSWSSLSRLMPAWSKRMLHFGRASRQLRYSTSGKLPLTQQSYVAVEDQGVRSPDALRLCVSFEGIKFNHCLVLSWSGIHTTSSDILDDQLVVGCADGTILNFVIDRKTLLALEKTHAYMPT
jgi:WD40 repeat protein